MVGSASGDLAAAAGKEGDDGQDARYAAGLERFHAALEKYHLAEAELARVRADLSRQGIRLDARDDLHW